jgi:hypothetical protein
MSFFINRGIDDSGKEWSREQLLRNYTSQPVQYSIDYLCQSGSWFAVHSSPFAVGGAQDFVLVLEFGLWRVLTPGAVRVENGFGQSIIETRLLRGSLFESTSLQTQ